MAAHEKILPVDTDKLLICSIGLATATKLLDGTTQLKIKGGAIVRVWRSSTNWYQAVRIPNGRPVGYRSMGVLNKELMKFAQAQ